MTGTEGIDLVKSHLGNRASGVIGSMQVDPACLASLNKAQIYICKRVNIRELQQTATLNLTTSNYSYTMPTPTSNCTIKNVLNTTLRQTSETTGRLLKRLTSNLVDTQYPYMDSSRTSRPVYYSYYASAIRFYPWPDTDYTAYLKINCYPPELAADDETLMGDEWDASIEAYATFDAFAKLQQTQDALNWFNIFWREYKETIGAFYKNPDLIQDMETVDNIGNTIGYEPGLDPFIRSVR